MFKLPYSRSLPYHRLPKWFNEADTKEVEALLAEIYALYLERELKKKATDIKLSEDDSHKKPDVYITINDNIKGIQITQFMLNNYLSRFNQSRKLCERMSKNISNIVKPEIKINIQVFSPSKRKDIVPQSSKKTFSKLANLIASKISENTDFLKSNNKYLNFHISDKKLTDIAVGFNLYPVPNDCHSNYYGSNGIYIDYRFDDIYISKNDILNEVDKVYNSKNNGKAEILLIWADQKQLMDKYYEIRDALKEKFQSNTTFETVCFMSFYNLLDIKQREINVSDILKE